MVAKHTHTQLTHAEIIHLQHDLYLLKLDDDYEIELEDAIEIDQAFINITNNQPFCVVVDARNRYSSASNDARNFFANDPEILPIRKKIAIVVNNMPTRIIANFFVKFNQPQTPTKVFNDYNKAIEWLKED
ncbi:MAG TPA: STAS/SEC14 domain-containing protein [Vicingaceae bacterium]